MKRDPLPLPDDDTQLLAEVVRYYHRELKSSPEVLSYLKKRGIENEEAIQHFKIGFSNRTLTFALPEKTKKLGQQVRERLARLGIYRDTGHEHLAGSLVIPAFAANGQVLGLYGRKVTGNLRTGTPLHLYVPDPLPGIWNLAGLAGPTVAIADSLLNALSLWCSGHRSVTAAIGGVIGRELLAELQRLKPEQVLLAFRTTPASIEATKVAVELLTAHALTVATVPFPSGLDANDVLRRSGAQALAELIPRAAPVAMPVSTSIEAAVTAMADDHQATQEPAGDRQDDVTTSPPPTPVPIDPGPDQSPSRTPPAPAAQSAAEVDQVVLRFEERTYRIRGLERNTSYAQLKVSLMAYLADEHGQPERFHVDSIDLLQAKQRAAFQKQAASELSCTEDLIKRDLGRVLLRLEELQEQLIRKVVQPSAPAVTLTEVETSAAMALLRAPDLLDRVLRDFDRCGVLGEDATRLGGYLATISRRLPDPLAVVIQSSSAAGKSSLLDGILAFVPPEERATYSALTGQALYYLGSTELAHKVLAIAEDAGAERASYALKLLQSQGELTIASTGKDATTGRMVTQTYAVRGPVALFLTTTAVDVDPELLNRCIVLTVNEDREQTRAIHRLQRQRQTLEGVLADQERAEVVKLHQNAQRLLRPLLVVNPYAPRLTFLDDRTRSRRDHAKYLALIRAVALLHQHQRQVKTIEKGGKSIEYIEVIPSDVAVANRLADQLLGRSLDDLPPHTRRLLLQLDGLVQELAQAEGIERPQVRFTRKQLRDRLGAGDTQLKVHLKRLVELEYLVLHRRGHGFEYELAFDGRGQDGKPVLPGLIDPATLTYDGERSEIGRPLVGPQSAGGRGGESPETPCARSHLHANGSAHGENAHVEHVSEHPGSVVGGGEGGRR